MTKTPLLIDIETDGRIPQRGELLLVGWCVVGEPVQVMEPRTGLMPDPHLDLLQSMLADPERPVVSMTKYDARYLRLQGWEVTGPYYDIQVMAWVLNENQPLSLDFIARRYCGIKMDKRLRRSKGDVWFKADSGQEVKLTDIRPGPSDDGYIKNELVWDQFIAYCRRDVEAEVEVFQTLQEKLVDTTWAEYWQEEEVPFTEALLGMECAGMPINLNDSENLREELEELVGELRPVLLADGGLPPSFNLNSGDQLAAYLYYPVMELADSLDWGVDAVACLKSCLAGEHEDCSWDEDFPTFPHVVDLLPPRFSITSVGREQVHGVWTVKGRGLEPTDKTPSEKRWSTSTPTLKSNLAAAVDPWVQQLMVYRQHEKALTTYLRRYPELAVNEQGETYEDVLGMRGGVRPVEEDTAGVGEVLQPGVQRPGGRNPAPSGPDVDGLQAADSRRGDTPGAPVRGAGTAGRAGAPHQHGEDGQPAGELDAAAYSRVAQSGAPSDAGTFRVFGRFNQTGTKTGRLSASEPNLQNQPAHGDLGRRMRSLFQGRLVVGDYSQLEPRLMAHFSEDPRLLAVYRGGHDVYLDLAHAIFGEQVTKEDAERGICKVLVLALGYGAGDKKVAQILTINGYPTTPFVADGYLKELQGYYNRFFAWREHVIRKVKVRGYVETIGGRHRRLRAAFADKKNWKNIGYGERQAVNAIVQGSAGDIVRRVMVNGVFPQGMTLLAQVHDELVWEWAGLAPSDGLLRGIQNEGETAHGFDLRVPLVFEPHFGDSWWSAKEGAPLLLPEDLETEETVEYAEELS